MHYGLICIRDILTRCSAFQTLRYLSTLQYRFFHLINDFNSILHSMPTTTMLI
uniref:Uncharacterized protein n=1 Tax=Anguilla anguilla TaxID=7936 RepID=A0A0E9WWU8_ANGAN